MLLLQLVILVVGRAGLGETEGGGAEPSGPLDDTARAGRSQYELMIIESKMPKYGDCYLDTLKDLDEGCAKLDDEIQSRLALAFTNCYLGKFGWTMFPCGPTDPLSRCMTKMDPLAASVFSSMLTSTLSMCHFLQAQAWHRDTSNAVHSLREASDAVTYQLAEAVDSAATLRQEIDSQISESRKALRSAFSEFRESTAEQRGLIVDVFDKVAQLHTLVMGEFSWFYAVVFYVSGVMVTMLATCTPRTQRARLPLITTLSLSMMLERLVVSVILDYFNPDNPQDSVQCGVWIVRRLAVTFCCVLLMHSAVTFSDPLAVTTMKLEELTKAAGEVKRLMIRASGSSISPIPEGRENSNSSSEGESGEDDSGLDEDWTASFLDSSQLTLVNVNKNIRYWLRPRPTVSPASNPILTLETPTMFGRIIKNLEDFDRRRRRHLSHGDNVHNRLELKEVEVEVHAETSDSSSGWLSDCDSPAP